MRVIALDLSGHAGWALMERHGDAPPELLACGRVDMTEGLRDRQPYPWGYLGAAQAQAESVLGRVRECLPVDEVVIEETNKGKDRYTQKGLEWLHCFILQGLWELGVTVVYVNTSEWRRVAGVALTKDDKRVNALLSRSKRKGPDALKAAKLKVGRRGRVKVKGVAVRWARATFNLTLLEGDHDASEAIGQATARLLGAAAALPTR